MKRLPPISSKLSFLIRLLASAFLLLAFTVFPTIQQRPYLLLSTFTHDLTSSSKSSSAFMFFACNLIIITIALTSTSPPNAEDELGQMSTQNVPFDGGRWQQGANPEYVDTESSNSGGCKEEEEIIETDIDTPRCNYEDEEDGSFGDEDYCYSNCDSDDIAELHKRIEEFISKTLNEWREEKMRDTQMLNHEGL